MLTAEQIKTLEELGFEYEMMCYWAKYYNKRGYIAVNESNCEAYPHYVKSCKEAQADLAKLREKGII